MNYRYIKALGLSSDNISLAYDVITKKDGVEWMESCNIAVEHITNFRWEDAKRAYHKFTNDEKIMRHIQRNPCTLRYTYSYTLIYTLHIEYTQNNRLLHKIIGTKE